MAERADTPPSVMTNDMFERHYERVFGSGSPINFPRPHGRGIGSFKLTEG